MTIPDTPSEDVALLGQVNGNAYDAVANPKGMARGGHRQNWASAMNALASVASWVASVVGYITTLSNQVAADAASAAAGSGTESTVANIRSGVSAFFLSIRRIYEANAPVALSDGTAIAWDMSQGINFIVTLGAAGRTLANPTGVVPGKSGIIIFKQDATGGRSVSTYGNNLIWIGGQPDWPSAAGKRTVVAYYVEADGSVLLNFGGNQI